MAERKLTPAQERILEHLVVMDKSRLVVIPQRRGFYAYCHPHCWKMAQASIRVLLDSPYLEKTAAEDTVPDVYSPRCTVYKASDAGRLYIDRLR